MVSAGTESNCSPVEVSVNVQVIDYEINFDQPDQFCFSVNDTQEVELTPVITGLTPTELQNATFTWQDGSQSSSLIINGAGTYELEVEYQGCIKTSFIDIDFGVMPDVTPIQDQEFCPEGTIDYNVQVSNSTDYQNIEFEWINSQNEIVGSSSQLAITEEDVYFLIVTGETQEGVICESIQEVQVQEKDIHLSLGDDKSFCGVNSFEIIPDIAGEDIVAPTYIWKDNTGSVLGNSETLTIDNSGIYTLIVHTEDCSISDTIAINLFQNAEVDLGSDIVTCDDQEDLPLLNATPQNLSLSEVNFEWSFNGEILNETTATLNSALYGFGNYEVSVEVINGGEVCENTIQTISITKLYEPEIDLIANREYKTYCVGETVNIHALITGLSESENISYVWFENGNMMEEEHSASLTFTMTDQFSSPTIYDIMVGEKSCEALASIEIKKYNNEDCVITQGLSPSLKDGLNDYLDLKFLDDRSGIENIKIFNRYGTVVYEKDNYVDSFIGNNSNGESLVTGTYFYVIELKNSDPVFANPVRGWIYINN